MMEFVEKNLEALTNVPYLASLCILCFVFFKIIMKLIDVIDRRKKGD